MKTKTPVHVCATFTDIQRVNQFLQTKASDEDKQVQLDKLLNKRNVCPKCKALLKAHLDM